MRYINFTMPGSPSVRVHMEERTDGTVYTTLQLDGRKADLRGLFFDVRDPSLIPHLSAAGPHLTRSIFSNDRVFDLGQGVNMHGAVRKAFDVGLAFGTPGNGKDIVQSTSFVLTSKVGGLNLDDLALVQFGARLTGGAGDSKIVFRAPAAPDARNDSLSAYEDVSKTFAVMANDSDADGTADFRIVSVSDPAHGTATISADGKTVIYIADKNYSGPDSFVYAMIDGHGGGDDAIATINVIAVADAPTLTLRTAPGANANQILVTVTGSVTDTDGSEYIDRYIFSGLPTGATIVGYPGLVFDPPNFNKTHAKTFTLELAPDTDFDFDLGVTAVAKEKSNGDEEATFKSLAVAIDAHSNSFELTFEANNRSMWDSGGAFSIVDDRFLGIDVDSGEQEVDAGIIEAGAQASLRAGFHSQLTLNGGEIDAALPYAIEIDTTYNHVTDILMIESSADLLSEEAGFTTDGPDGSYLLDFIFDWYVNAYIDLVIDFGIFGEFDETLWSFDSGFDFTRNIIDLDSEEIGFDYEFGYGLGIELAWPDVDAESLVSTTNVFTGAGESQNFFNLVLDVDQALADIFLKGENPFNIDIDYGVGSGTIELLDFDLLAGLNLLQSFAMTVGSLAGTLVFENGTERPWDFGDIVLAKASDYDADGDGIIEFALELNPSVTMSNDIDLGVNLGYRFDLLKASGDYDVGFDDGDWEIGPAWETSATLPLASTDLVSMDFALAFQSQTLTFAGNEGLVV